MSYLKDFGWFALKWTLIIGLFGGFIYYMKKQTNDAETKAQAELTPYNDQIDRYMTKKLDADTLIPASGNVIFVDAKTRKLDKLTEYGLSPYNTPKSPMDVDSVVLHSCDYLQVGTYSNGSRAMQQVCEFTVIDVLTGAWSKWGEFKGSMPLDEIQRRRGSNSDEIGGRAVNAFFMAGGLVHRNALPK